MYLCDYNIRFIQWHCGDVSFIYFLYVNIRYKVGQRVGNKREGEENMFYSWKFCVRRKWFDFVVGDRFKTNNV